jgi:hypothetical protein
MASFNYLDGNGHIVEISAASGAGTSADPYVISLGVASLVPGTSATSLGKAEDAAHASGDTGIRSVQTLTLSAASLAGTAALCLYKPLAVLPITTLGVCAERDLMNQLPSLPQIQDGACLTWLYFTGAATAASTNLYGYCDFAYG